MDGQDLAIGISEPIAGAATPNGIFLSASPSTARRARLREAEGPLTAREALREILHDAPEPLMGGFDPIASIKPHLGPAFEQLDRACKAPSINATNCSLDRRNLRPAQARDRLAAANEAYHVVGWSRDEMRDSLGITLVPLDADPLTLHPACSRGSLGRRRSLKHCSCSGLLNF